MLNEKELEQAAKEAQEAILKALDDILKNSHDKNKKAPVSKDFQKINAYNKT